ncbi:MAG: alpha/beta hydrolase [Desulfuromonadales bacterium]|nr:alpha/beta hydrolase [Desulfuromonadales bacterium]
MNRKVLILPGIGSSGPGHWQTLWERSNPLFTRVEQRDWEAPLCSEWVDTLEQSVARSGPDTVLVAHSLACLLVAHWAAGSTLPIRGALLVAVPDPAGSCFPGGTLGFAPLPRMRFPFPNIVVASSNDPYASLAFSREFAGLWGGRLIIIGDAGHINADSGFGEWPEGFDILKSMLA